MQRGKIRLLIVACWGCLLLASGWSPAMELGGIETTTRSPRTIAHSLDPNSPLDRLLQRSPAKVHTVRLFAGQTYLLETRSVDFNPYLRVEIDQQPVLENDDIGPTDPTAAVVFTPGQTRSVEVVVTSWEPRQRGDYVLRVWPLAKRDDPEIVSGQLTPDSQQVRGLLTHRHEVRLRGGRLYHGRLRSDRRELTMMLFDDEGEVLAEGEQLVAATPRTGDYALQILAIQTGQTGAYRVELQSYELPTEPDWTPREKLRREADERFLEAMAFLEAGRDSPAERLLRRHLCLVRRLYPRRDWPEGHPVLAHALNNLGVVVAAHGRYEEALRLHKEVLQIRRRIHPKEIYPDGHPDLAKTFVNLGYALEHRGEYLKAQEYFERSLEMRTRLLDAPAAGNGHPELVESLSHLGLIHDRQGRPGRARQYLERAMKMNRWLYPAEYFPSGHPELARSLNNLAGVYLSQGEYAQAEPLFREALRMRRDLYPAELYPEGHPALASSLNNLAFVLQKRGRLDGAVECFQQALDINQRLYSAETEAAGHPSVALSWNNLGGAYQEMDQLDRAREAFVKALEMRRRLYPAEKYPQGHPQLAVSWNNMGTLLAALGEYARAQACYERALEMNRRLYPPDAYPAGHPALAATLFNLGCLHATRQQDPLAEACFREALDIYCTLTERFAELSSETEALNFRAQLPVALDHLLSVTRRQSPQPKVYDAVWRSRSAVTRIFQRRHMDLRARATPQTRLLARELNEVRQRLAWLLLGDMAKRAETAEELRELTGRKEELERQIAAHLGRSPQDGGRAGSAAELCRRLPAGAVFIDTLQYLDYWSERRGDHSETQPASMDYAAFVIDSGGVRRVELGDAAAIDEAIDDWRRHARALATRGFTEDPWQIPDSTAPQRLNELIWQRLSMHIPDRATTIYIAPDGALTRLAWGAISSDDGAHVLLERYAFALVPHGPFLLRALGGSSVVSSKLLLVGGVDYDAMVEAPAVADGKGFDHRAEPSVTAAEAVVWSPLPGTGREVRWIKSLAESQIVSTLTGGAATRRRLLEELPQARCAHLATHGFFAEGSANRPGRPKQQVGLRLLAGTRSGGERVLAPARHPLPLTGLVLAGANRPETPSRGIVTGAAILGLDLRDLDLAVLSACETGLGDVAEGEGVYGLQLAFHYAGARYVVASLWKVDDRATAALMSVFYRKLWEENLTPLEALRQAQLAIYLDPERVSNPDGQVEVPTPEKRPAAEERTRDDGSKPTRERAPVSWWAAFVLSGA